MSNANAPAIPDTDFQNRTFEESPHFSGAVFTRPVNFSGATFKKFVTFDSAIFTQTANFIGCRFEQGASFSLARFKDVNFLQSIFLGRALFWRTSFTGRSEFSQFKVVKSSQPLPMGDQDANFSWATFAENARFTYATFETPVYFHRTLFADDVLFENCHFHDTLYLNGKRNEVLFPRFGPINPGVIAQLESAGLFTADTERHRSYQGEVLSEFVRFNNVMSLEDLRRRCEGLPNAPDERGRLEAAWQEGARKMFAEGRVVSFLGTRFYAPSRLKCEYLELDGVVVDRQIAGSAEDRAWFDKQLKATSFDVFISHASEEKISVARPLKDKLWQMGCAVWLDENALQVGDKLTEALEEAVSRCRYGVIILSPSYLAKKWTRWELERLLGQAKASGKKLFFIWHNLTEAQVKEWSPIIADYIGGSTDKDAVSVLAERLMKAMH